MITNKSVNDGAGNGEANIQNNNLIKNDDDNNKMNMDNEDDDESSLKNRFTHVRVLHNFRGSNNDELCMKKDDIITLTQTPSGGWWEGTLDGITGWFPSNYVTPIHSTDPTYQQLIHTNTNRPDSSDPYGIYDPNKTNDDLTNSDSLGNHLSEYRGLVTKVIEESETAFIQSLQDAINHYLKPIYQFKIIPNETELNAVLRSTTEICSVHKRFLNSIEKIKSIPYKDNRIGGLFMQYAPQFKHAHFEYCSHHAKFVHVIEKYKKEICAFFQNQHPPPARNLISPNHSTSSNSANTLSSMPNVQITSLLSISFRRLDKYPALLQELQRYTEENHSDRGDIQRAGFVYREISMSCLELRRRKEMELEVMLGNIKNFDNFNIENYGQIIKMEPVSILILHIWLEPKKDCYLVLFSKLLMILSVGKEMTSFTFESMMKLEGAKLQPIYLPNNNEGASIQSYTLEISGHNAHNYQTEPEQLTYVVEFSSEEILREYYQLLQKQIRHQTLPLQQAEQTSSMSISSSSILQQNGPGAASSSSSTSSAIFSPQSSSISITSPDQPIPSTLPPKPTQYRIQHIAEQPIVYYHHHHHRPPPPAPIIAGNIEAAYKSLPKRTSYWSDQLLTPHVPYRPTDLNQSSLLDQEPNDDMQLLNVIDAYHRKFPSGSRGSALINAGEFGKLQRKHSNNQEMDNNHPSELEPHQYVEIIGATKLTRNPSTRNARKNSLTMLVNRINKLSLSSMDRDVLYEIYDQLRVIRNEMSHLSEKVRDERRQRKRLQHSLVKIQQQNQQQTAA